MVGTMSKAKPFNVKLDMTYNEARLIKDALQHYDPNTTTSNADEQLRSVMVVQLRDVLA